MAIQIVPTKGNPLATKRSLSLARAGFGLMDCKHNILIRKMMALIERANKLQDKIDRTYDAAYAALQMANVTPGVCGKIAEAVPYDDNLDVAYRSIMGVEIPMMSLEHTPPTLNYDLMDANTMMDDAYLKFREVKYLTAELAEVKNSIYRLADNVKKTQKHANALRNTMIPHFEETMKFITNALEERDKEEFSHLKVIKRWETAG